MTLNKTKFESNWKFKTLENLEKDYWVEPNGDSYLIKTCHQLRKKPLQDFKTEDLRIMISQEIGLKYLIPLAFETLKEDIFAEGDYYEGDLLKSVLTSDREFWRKETDLFNELEELIQKNRQSLKEQEPELLDIFNDLYKNYKQAGR